MKKNNFWENCSKGIGSMDTQVFKTTITLILTSSYLSASSCSSGFCGVSVPYIPSDIQENTQLKPFNAANNKEIKNNYSGWGLVDNGGDTTIGENRLMSGLDFNSVFGEGDQLSLFGLITSESLTSGKLSYGYPLFSNDVMVQASYIYTNYTLNVPFPGATGIGTTSSIEGKIIYPTLDSEKEKFDLSLSFNNNNIDDEITNGPVVTNSEKASYSATANIDYKNANNKLHIGLTSGYLSFDNESDKKLDGLTYDTQGGYTKINIDYKNTMALSENTTLESNFRSQFAFSSKNLDDSESFTIGGINGVKVYEESSVYSSNGILANIEAKYKLPALNGVNNSIGTFYDYGRVWESNSIIPSTKKISVQDAGLGIYTNYKKFFSTVQLAMELGDSEISTKDDENYRVILQAGFTF